MRFLFLGDMVGRTGRVAVQERLPGLVHDWRLDFVVVNGENAAGGEWGGGVLIISENAPPERRGFFSAWSQVGVAGGFVLSAGAFGRDRLFQDLHDHFRLALHHLGNFTGFQNFRLVLKLAEVGPPGWVSGNNSLGKPQE